MRSFHAIFLRHKGATPIRVRGDDPALTGVAGLVPFGAFVQQLGVDRELRERFGGLKRGKLVVYPMEADTLGTKVDASCPAALRAHSHAELSVGPA
jgi:hypothetical protein